MRRAFLRIMAAGLASMVLAACQPEPPPPPPPPTVVELTVAAAPTVNPAPDGRPSPVVVRVYELASPTTFNQADFLRLFNDDQGTLGADMLGRQELTLTPGSVQNVRRELRPEARFLGVVAAYRAYDQAVWRAVVPVPPNQTTPLTADVGPLAVTLR